MNRVHASSAAQAQPIAIREDWLVRKIFSCIPILGIIVGKANEFLLAQKIRREENPERVVELIDIKNEYKGASVIRNLLTAASCAAAIALGVFTKASFIYVAIFTGLAAFHYYQILQNHKIQDSIENNGLRPGLRVL